MPNMNRTDPSTPPMPYHPSLGWSIAKNATRGLVTALNEYLEAKLMLHRARDARERRIAEINYRNQQQELQNAQILVEQSKLALEQTEYEDAPEQRPEQMAQNLPITDRDSAGQIGGRVEQERFGNVSTVETDPIGTDPSIEADREAKLDQDVAAYKAQLKQEGEQEKRNYEQKFIEAQNKRIDETPDLTDEQRQRLKITPSGHRSKLLDDALRIGIIRQYNTPEDAQRLIQQYINPASDADIAEIEGGFNDLSKIDEWEKARLVDIETAELVRRSVFDSLNRRLKVDSSLEAADLSRSDRGAITEQAQHILNDIIQRRETDAERK